METFGEMREPEWANLMSSVDPRIVHSPRYDIGFPGLDKLHPFDTRKYSRAYGVLKERFGRDLEAVTLAPARPVNNEELLAVHAADYLHQLRDPAYLARVLEVPQLRRVPARIIDWLVLRHMRWAVMGTVIAAREAFRGRLVVNLSGGYHHAGPDRGEGFCIYNDIAFAIHDVRQSGFLSDGDRVVYVDLDAHQGNGVCRAFLDDPRVFIFDMFNQSIYPADPDAKRRIDCAAPLPAGCADGRYLRELQSKLPPFLDSVAKARGVGLAIYNAGTDVFSGDQLGGMDVSAEGVLRRDQFVIRQLVERGIPAVMLLSGGYSATSYRLVADSVGWLLESKGGTSEDKT